MFSGRAAHTSRPVTVNPPGRVHLDAKERRRIAERVDHLRAITAPRNCTTLRRCNGTLVLDPHSPGGGVAQHQHAGRGPAKERKVKSPASTNPSTIWLGRGEAAALEGISPHTLSTRVARDSSRYVTRIEPDPRGGRPRRMSSRASRLILGVRPLAGCPASARGRQEHVRAWRLAY